MERLRAFHPASAWHAAPARDPAGNSSPSRFAIRPARPSDLPTLLDIERRCFTSDLLSRQSLRRFLADGRSTCLVVAGRKRICGYVLVLYPARCVHARLYSLAVEPDSWGQRIGHSLLVAAERAARLNGRAAMRLEVRTDNRDALRLYRHNGYQDVGRINHYYKDGGDALRLSKRLRGREKPDSHIPHYEQTLEFTCGPAALLMAMAALDPKTELTRRAELRIWRESTLIFMTAGHGGCDPYGLALAAKRRGFGASTFVNIPEELFLHSVRSEHKRDVMRIVQRDFRSQLRAAKVDCHARPLRPTELRTFIDEGAVPLVLVSGYQFFYQKIPHWVVVTDYDDEFVYVHDPYVWRRASMTPADSMDVPVPRKDFERMSRYGKVKLQASLILFGPTRLKRARRSRANARG